MKKLLIGLAVAAFILAIFVLGAYLSVCSESAHGIVVCPSWYNRG